MAVRAVLGLFAFLVGAGFLICFRLLSPPVPEHEARALWEARYGGVTCSERGECWKLEVVGVRKGEVRRSAPGRDFWHLGSRVRTSVVYCFDRSKVLGRQADPGSATVTWERKLAPLPECYTFHRLYGGDRRWEPL